MTKLLLMTKLYYYKCKHIYILTDIIKLLIPIVPGLIMWTNGVWLGAEETILGFNSFFDYLNFVLISIAFWCFIETMWRMINFCYQQFKIDHLSTIVFFPSSTKIKFLAWVHSGLYLTIINNFIYLLPILIYLIINYGIIKILLSILILYLTLIISYAFGMIVFIISLWFKQGLNFINFINGFLLIVGGLYFPVNYLPDYLNYLLMLFPFSIGIDLFRFILLNINSFTIWYYLLLILIIQIIIYLFIANHIYKWIVKYVKNNGFIVNN